jgi:hypothetical protein
MKDDEFFIGWAPTPRRDRRFMLGATLGVVAAGAGFAALLSQAHEPAGAGRWNQGDVRTFSGRLVREPYPALLTSDIDGALRTAFLVSNGKSGVQERLRRVGVESVRVQGTLIARGANAMIAAVDGADWIDDGPPAPDPNWTAVDEGPALLAGEILDAKCWFGAMRPGAGKVHKSCASLCIRGGLPAAFCANGCGDGAEILLFVDANGRAHSRDLLPYVADPVYASGRIVRVGDVRQFRVDMSDVRRM